MSYSYTNSESQTFTLTNAKKIAAKVATDLKRMQRFYGMPSDYDIQKYEEEVVLFLQAGYLQKVSYGYKKDDKWIEPSIHYTAQELNDSSSTDDDPGKIRPGANITNANFYSYLIKNYKWAILSSDEKEAFNKTLPFQRTGANEPGINGHLVQDKTYSSGGKAIIRSTVKNY